MRMSSAIMYSTLLALMMLSFAPLRSIAQQPAGDDKIRWVSLEEADRLRQDEPRKILIDVYTDWCGWCKRMDATTFRDPKLVAYVNENFYAVKLDAEQREPITIGGRTYAFVEQGSRGYHEIAYELLQGKMSYPTIVFLDERMNMIQPLPGFMEAKDLLPILHYLAEDAYRQTPWEEWSSEYEKTHQ